jgi:hypothetical protein
MAGQKFIQHGVNGLGENIAPQVGGAGSENKIPALDSNGRLDQTMMPSGLGADTAGIAASEALAAGDFVNVYNDAGVGKVRKADATTNGKPANGFVKASVSSGALATVFFDGNNDAVTGATAGAAYLSVTAGGASSTAPSASGNLVQRLGVATSATSINFTQTAGVTLA